MGSGCDLDRIWCGFNSRHGSGQVSAPSGSNPVTAGSGQVSAPSGSNPVTAGSDLSSQSSGVPTSLGSGARVRFCWLATGKMTAHAVGTCMRLQEPAHSRSPLQGLYHIISSIPARESNPVASLPSRLTGSLPHPWNREIFRFSLHLCEMCAQDRTGDRRACQVGRYR